MRLQASSFRETPKHQKAMRRFGHSEDSEIVLFGVVIQVYQVSWQIVWAQVAWVLSAVNASIIGHLVAVCFIHISIMAFVAFASRSAFPNENTNWFIMMYVWCLRRPAYWDQTRIRQILEWRWRQHQGTSGNRTKKKKNKSILNILEKKISLWFHLRHLCSSCARYKHAKWSALCISETSFYTNNFM